MSFDIGAVGDLERYLGVNYVEKKFEDGDSVVKVLLATQVDYIVSLVATFLQKEQCCRHLLATAPLPKSEDALHEVRPM